MTERTTPVSRTPRVAALTAALLTAVLAVTSPTANAEPSPSPSPSSAESSWPASPASASTTGSSADAAELRADAYYQSAGRVTVRVWFPDDPEVTSARVERGDCVTSSFEPIFELARPAPNDYAYRNDTTPPRGSDVCYRVVGLAGGVSVPSAMLVTEKAEVPWVDPVYGLRTTAGDTSIRVGWWRIDDPATVGVRVTRTQSGQPPVVVYDGTAREFVDTGLLPATSVTYEAVARDAAGHLSYPLTTTGRTVQSYATDEDPKVGSPTDLACPTTTWCMLVDLSGQYQVLDGTTWSAPGRLAPVSRTDREWSLTCPAKGWCLARGNDGIRRYSGGGWSDLITMPQPPTAPYASLTCTSSTWCVAMTADARVTTFDGAGWAPLAYVSNLRDVSWDDVACQAQARCFAVGTYTPTGSIWRASLVSGRWTTGHLGSPATPGLTIDCPSTTWCAAVGRSASWTITGTRWSGRTALAKNRSGLRQQSCASATLCWKLDLGSTASRWNGSEWLARTPLAYTLNSATSVSCPRGAALCHAVDDRGRHYRWTASTGWRTVSTATETYGDMGRPACPTSSTCMAFDRNGWLHQFDGTTWTRPARMFQNPASVACSPGFCLAIQELGSLYRTWSNGVWSAARTTPPYLVAGGLDCASANACIATSSLGTAWRFTGSAWVAAGTPFPAASGAFGYSSVECAAGPWCLASTESGHWTTWSGSGWSAVKTLPTGGMGYRPLLVSCSDRAFCLAAGEGGTARWNGSSWTLVDEGGRDFNGMDCPSTDFCTAGHWSDYDAGFPSVWTAGGWTWGASYPTRRSTKFVECMTPRVCLLGNYGSVTRTVPTAPPPL